MFVYYFFESYAPAQKNFTEEVQRELEHLGELYGDKVSLLMPNPRYSGRIEAEVRDNPALWGTLRGHLPGLFISRTPLNKINGASDGTYIPFDGEDPRDVARVIKQVRGIADQVIEWETGHPKPTGGLSRLGDLFDAVEMKPGIWGFRIDLKKLRRR
jgi:hypothetical protein